MSKRELLSREGAAVDYSSEAETCLNLRGREKLMNKSQDHKMSDMEGAYLADEKTEPENPGQCNFHFLLKSAMPQSTLGWPSLLSSLTDLENIPRSEKKSLSYETICKRKLDGANAPGKVLQRLVGQEERKGFTLSESSDENWVAQIIAGKIEVFHFPVHFGVILCKYTKNKLLEKCI